MRSRPKVVWKHRVNPEAKWWLSPARITLMRSRCWIARTLPHDLRIGDRAKPAKRHGCVGYGVLMKSRGLIGQRLVCKHSILLLTHLEVVLKCDLAIQHFLLPT
jgi:hypothetical protein